METSSSQPTELQRARDLLATTLRVLQEEPPTRQIDEAIAHLARSVHQLDALDQVDDGKREEHLDDAGGHASTALGLIIDAAFTDVSPERREALAKVRASLETALDLFAHFAMDLGLELGASSPEIFVHRSSIPSPRTSVRPPRPVSRPSMPAVKDDDRRHAPRIALEIGIGVASDHNFYTGLTEDVSTGGLFVATWQPLTIGTEVDLEFILPGDIAVKVHGKVRWLRDPRDSDTVPGMGIQFLNLDSDAVKLVTRFVEKRAALFWDD